MTRFGKFSVDLVNKKLHKGIKIPKIGKINLSNSEFKIMNGYIEGGMSIVREEFRPEEILLETE
jgi:hypothetical protein